MAMLSVPRHNYREILLTIRDLGHPEKPPYDLTDCRVVVTVKEHTTDGDDLIRIQKDNIGGGVEITNAAQGEASLIVTPGDMDLPPSDYYYDVFVIKDGTEVYSSKVDIFRVTPTVPRGLPT